MDVTGIPLAIITTPANVHDSVPAMRLVDRVPRLPDAQGRPRQPRADGHLRRPVKVLLGDKAYGTPRNMRGCRRRNIAALLARPRSTWATGLGAVRYVVERAFACLGHCRRIKLCYEKSGPHFQAFNELAAIGLCAQRLYGKTWF